MAFKKILGSRFEGITGREALQLFPFFFFAPFCEMPLLWIPKAKQELIGVLHVHIPMLAYFSEGSLFQLDIAILTLSKE